jgi:glycosyltransferase involved in cell wall biosynthesis
MPISTSKLVEHFSSNASFQTYCVFPSEGAFPQKARSQGACVTILPFFSLKKGLKSLLTILTWFSALLRFYQFLKKNNISVVHFSDFIDFPYYPAALFAGIPSIAHLRMCIENKFQRLFFKFWATVFCTKIVCISEAVCNFASLEKKMCRVIYNPGPDPKLFDPSTPFSKPRQFSESKYVIVTIANFRPVKGQEHFVKIASIMEKRYPGKCHYIMIGDHLPAHQHYFDNLKDMISNLNLNEHFTIIENVPHETVPSYIAHSTVLVHLPNYQEGFGGVILEAMMMGVPVVAFDSGGIGECYTDNVSGYIVQQYDTEAAANAVLRLVQNSDLHKQMSNNAFNEIKKFSYTRHFSEIESLYREVTF